MRIVLGVAAPSDSARLSAPPSESRIPTEPSHSIGHLKRPLSKRLLQSQRPLPSQNNNLIRLRDLLQKQTTCPLKGSSPSRSFTRPKSPSKPLRRSVAPTAR